MMNRQDMMNWQGAGEAAEGLVISIDRQVSIRQIQSESEKLKFKIKVVGTIEITRVKDQKGISIDEYTNIFISLLDSPELDLKRLRSYADTIAHIIWDMKSGTMHSDEYYKMIATGTDGETLP